MTTNYNKERKYEHVNDKGGTRNCEIFEHGFFKKCPRTECRMQIDFQSEQILKQLTKWKCLPLTRTGSHYTHNLPGMVDSAHPPAQFIFLKLTHDMIFSRYARLYTWVPFHLYIFWNSWYLCFNFLYTNDLHVFISSLRFLNEFCVTLSLIFLHSTSADFAKLWVF